MNFLFQTLFLVTAVVTLSTAVVLDKGHELPRDFDFKTLSNYEKFKLFLASKASPQSFKDFPKDKGNFAEIQEADDYYMVIYIDNSFIDARTLFTQAKKIAPTANLPELKWGYSYDFCFWFWCIHMDVQYSTKDSRFIGGENITTTTKITPTQITNTFKVPCFNWTSPGFLVNVTDYLAQKIHLTNNSYYSFENTTISFTMDYGFVPDVGIQVGNLSIYYDAGRVRGGVQEFTVWDFDGNLLEKEVNDPEEFKIDETMMETWNYYKRRYSEGLVYSINCFLSNGRSDPENCLYGDNNDHWDDQARDYYKFLNVQLIQTIGLGALLE